MKQQSIDLLKAPSGKPLTLFREGRNEFLQTSIGEKYPVKDGIICFLNDNSITGNNRNFQKMYDRIARFYDISVKLYALIKEGSEKKRLFEYLSLIEVKDGNKVIEISIGTGRNIKYLNPNAEYFGVDISKGMLRRCRQKMIRNKREIILIQAEAESLPIRNETFDVVFSAGGFNFFNYPDKAVLEMLRIAKSGTKILITDETEKFRLKHARDNFYKKIPIQDPRIFLPSSCANIEYKEICNGDLYVLTFEKLK
ncbi:MAG: class I SAM-dependent methyltransferase [Bacteroidota bacterium]|nr:class I SAM-dependent methyltransferase [Bacteroidota bacterium]